MTKVSKEVSNYFSKLAKRGHKLNPRPVEYYKRIRAMVGKKLSTVDSVDIRRDKD